MANKKRIAIVGGGGSGATCCKACLSEGFDVVVYERTAYTCGLWRYRPIPEVGIASVSKRTINTSSKEMFAFSDFPPPDHMPNYMHHTKVAEYLDLYNKTFNYEKYVKFGHEVLRCEFNHDYESTGRWKVTVKDHNSFDGQGIKEEVFDGVMICTGHHHTPLMATFANQHVFSGQILHSHTYRDPDDYKDKEVVVVGTGNSGGDACVDFSTICKKVYLSTRSGMWSWKRLMPNATPADSWIIRRYIYIIESLMPYWLKNFVAEWIANHYVMNFEQAQLLPKNRILDQHVSMTDYLPLCIHSGSVIVKDNINRFTPNGVIFEGETSETKCDVVLLATGYRLSFPFLSESVIQMKDNRLDLYKNVFPYQHIHAHTLAFIGLIQPKGSLLNISELQARWFVQLMAKKVWLPNHQDMTREVERIKRLNINRYVASDRHTIEVDWIPCMEDLAKQIGVKPDLWKYFFTDFKLWRALMFGPLLPYQYRLNGPNSWSGARDAILEFDYRVKAPLMTRYPKKSLQRQSKSDNWFKIIYNPVFVVIISILLVYLLISF